MAAPAADVDGSMPALLSLETPIGLG